MNTIAIAELKAHLSAELKKVRAGATLLIMDRKQPVARIIPLNSGLKLSKRASRSPQWIDYEPLLQTDPLVALDAERAESW